MKPTCSCQECPVGIVSGEGAGQFCPLIERQHRKGEVLYRKGEDARYVWFIKSGVVELVDGDETGTPRILGRKGPGGFVGLESLVRSHYDTMVRFATDASLCGATREGFMQWLGPQSQRTCVVLGDLLSAHTETLAEGNTDDAPEDNVSGIRPSRRD